MKKALCLSSVVISIIYTAFYLHFGGLFGNASALSKVGLDYPVCFAIWGVLTFTALSINITYAYINTKYYKLAFLLIISFVGMALTLSCDFDYSKHSEYLAHCIGSLAFSAVTGTLVFLLFLLTKRYIRASICAIILLVDLVLLLIFKETALIEIVPIFAGYILLLTYNFEKERILIEA